MKSGLNFLVAARHCEISELEQLARTSELVALIGRMVHALQRERGLSIVFLSSQGTHFAAQRLQQIVECEKIAQQVRARFDALDTDVNRARNGARLFSRIALVLHGLDGLPGLRQCIGKLALSPEESTATLGRLVAGLLAVVFEAADNSNNPEISRALVALFNFMQGKEFAGQERAFGAAAFVSARPDATRQQQWLHLIESQERCLQVFTDFSDQAVLAAWCDSQKDGNIAELERLRRIGCTPSADRALDANLGQAWFDCCSRRIDTMKTLEDLLAANLRLLCEHKIGEARTELRDQQATLEALSREADAASAGGSDNRAAYGPQLDRSILDMVQQQSRRLQEMRSELDTVRAALNERKVVERAKGLLMAKRKLSEDEAYKMLRQTAMQQNRRLLDVAESVLTMAEYL